MARDAIDLSKRKLPSDASSEETFTVTFLGANDSRIDVPCGSDQYILDAGLDAGLEIPFTCRGGICGACVARCARRDGSERYHGFGVHAERRGNRGWDDVVVHGARERGRGD